MRQLTNSRAQIRMLPDGRRLHLHDGPIDVVLEAFGAFLEVQQAYHVAAKRFVSILDELCTELVLLRQPVSEESAPPSGKIARRMFAAVKPYALQAFITPMAAVAGAVAEELLETMTSAATLARAYANDGGDIALHLTAGEQFIVGMMNLPENLKNSESRSQGRGAYPFINTGFENLLGTTTIAFGEPIRGIATSGWRGRSFSLGIADAVTVLADTASKADAAATIIANAVDLPGHANIARIPAKELAPDSDLGERLVTQSVNHLAAHEIHEALDAGIRVAQSLRTSGLIRAAALSLQGETLVIGPKICSSRTVAA